MSLSDDEARLLAELEAVRVALDTVTERRKEYQTAAYVAHVARNRLDEAKARAQAMRTKSAIRSDLIRVRARNKGAA